MIFIYHFGLKLFDGSVHMHINTLIAFGLTNRLLENTELFTRIIYVVQSYTECHRIQNMLHITEFYNIHIYSNVSSFLKINI